MADGRKIPYLIELAADDKKIRQQMAKINWEELLGSKGKGFGDVLISDAKEAKDQIRRTLGGLDIDWSKILGAKEIGQLEQAVTKALSKSRKEIELFAASGDTAGLEKTIKYVSALGDELKGLGSNFDAAGLARGMGAFMKVLTPLAAKIEALADEPKKVEAAFDRLFSEKTSDNMAKVAGGFTVIGDAAGRAAVKVNKSIETMEEKLASIDAMLSEDYGKKFKFDTDLEDQFYSIDEAIEKVEKNIKQLSKTFNGMSSSDKDFDKTRIQLVQLYTEQIELYRKLELVDEEYTKKYSKDASLLRFNAIDPKAVIGEVKTIIETIVGDARRQLKDISVSTITTKDGINIPIKLPSQAELVKTINKYVKSINDSDAIHGVRLKLDSGWLNDTANVIEDKTIRAYGDTPADFDKNTSDLVKKTEERFDRIAGVINRKLSGDDGNGGILGKTADWRAKMLDLLRFDKESFSFKFDDKLIEQLNDMFEDYQLKLSVDAEFLSNQIKTVLENSSVSLGGGTANINPDVIMKAVMEGVKLALLGGEVPTITSSTTNEETVANQTDKIADDITDTAKHLDIAEEYVQDVVKKIQEVARYATKHIGTEKDSKGTKATRELFSRLGGSRVETIKDENGEEKKKIVPILDLVTISQTEDREAIAKMLEDALLPVDEFGDIKGVAVVDELSKFKDSSSKTISAFLESIDEVFYNLQINTSTVEQWVKKRQSKKVFDSANEKAKAARSLQTVRSAIKQGDAPSLEEIDQITADMSAYWAQLAKRQLTYKEKDIEALALDKRTSDPSLDFNKSLEMARQEIYEKLLADIKAPFTQLREARVSMGDATEGESVEAFRETAQGFFSTTKQLFVNLKKQAEETFKGTVFVRDKNGLVPKQIEKYKDFARVKDDAVIVDVEVNSSLNDVALGVVNGKYSGRPSAGAEKQMMRGQHADFTVPKRYEKTILERPTDYSGFKPQGVESKEINIEKSINGLKERIAKTESDIPELQKQIVALDAEVETKRQEAKNARDLLDAVLNNPNSTDEEKQAAKYAKIDAQFAFSEVNKERNRLVQQVDNMKSLQDGEKKLIKRLELTEQYNTLLFKKEELESSIIKMEKDSAPQEELQNQRQELDKINTRLTEVMSKATKAGGLYQQGAKREYSADEKKTYALKEIEKIDKDLITAKAQVQVSKSRLEQVDKKLKELETWKLGAGYGAAELAKIKDTKEQEFKSSIEYKSFDEALVEKIRNAKQQAEALINQAKNTHRDTFNEKVTNAMLRDGLNPYDKKATRDFMETQRGKQLATQYEQWVEEDTKRILDQYDIDVDKFRKETKELQQQALEEYKKRLVDGDLLDYGEIRENLKRKLEEEKVHRKQEYDPDKYRAKVNRLEADREAAIAYGGVGDKEILSPHIIEDQIGKQTELDKLLDKRIDKEKKIKDLEVAGVPDSDASVKQANKEKEILDIEIARYEMLIRNRKKLVEMRYDESKESTYTDEEKELYFTNEIVNYNQKIEDSLEKQEELRQKIATASEEEKTQLQYALKKEEDKVSGWRGKVSAFEGKIQNVGTAKSEVAATRTGETTGGLLGLIKETLAGSGGASDEILRVIAETVSQILEVITSGGIKVGVDSKVDTTSAKDLMLEKKLARIRTLEAEKAASANKSAWISSMSDEERATSVSTINRYDKNTVAKWKDMGADELIKVMQDITRSMDGLNKESVEYLAKQRELGRVLNVYKDKSPVKDEATITKKNGKSYINSKMLTEKDEVLKQLGLYDKYNPITSDGAIRDMFATPKDGGFTEKKAEELARLKKEIKDVNTTAKDNSGLKDAIPEETTKETDELTVRIERLKQKFEEAKNVGYLGKNDKDLEAFTKQLDDIDAVEKRQKALALGDLVNKKVAKNKRMYAGTTEINAAIRQHSNMEARDTLDNADLAMVEKYNKAYDALIAKHKEFATKGTLYDPENQKTLQNMAIKVKDLGKQLEKSIAESEQLKELVNNSGFYKGKQMSGQHMLSADETQNLESSMKSYLQSLNLGNLEHVKFDHTHRKLTATLRTSNKTVADLEVKYNEATGALYAYQKAERESLTGVPAFLNGFQKKFNSIMQYLSMTMSIHQVLAELRKGIQYVREIDLALTELKKVTNETEETYDRFLDTAAKTGARLGTTISAVTEATATFAKLGYSMEQATEMAESAIVYKNVGDNIASTEDAADSIISTMKGFRLEASESMAIVDRFNEVGNRFAITSQGIGEALRLSASALSEGGNSLDESIALITAANEVVNDPSSVGTALKTLTLRLRGSKTELEEMGEDVTNMATTTSQLQAKLLALTGGKVDIMLDANTFKNSTQILREMAEAWEDMTDIQRASALELMGGRLLPLRIEIYA
jgi:TP901 family phage tail tape measure protein